MYHKFFLVVLMLVLNVFLGVAQVNPFSKLNSSFDEQNPVISPDGQVLYFTRSNHPKNIGGERDPGDIWYSVLGPNGWSSPIHSDVLNSYDWNGVIGLHNDEIILHNHYATGSFLKTQGISKASRNNTGWTSPQNINIPYFKNHSEYFGGSISKDQNVLIFSLESYDTKGAEDLYVSLQRDGKWTEPKNLGDAINTKFQELTPFIYNDSLLYFSSNGHKGKGSTDVFVSKRMDDTWLKWSTPENVASINTEGRELGYRQYADFAVYTSTLNSDGYGDIKFYTETPLDSIFNQPAVEENPKQSITAVSVEEIPDNTIVLYGSVKSKTNGQSLSPEIIIKSEKGSIKAKVDGDVYITNLKSPGNYQITVAAPGYIAEQENIELLSGEARKLQKDFVLQPIAVGARVNLKNVLFEQSKDVIIESSFDQLNLVVDLMKQNPSMKIRLEGHTDNRGVAKHNQRLSKLRAKAVEDYFVKKGISGRRIKGKGYGGSQPIADNNDPELRKLNRRVEFTIIKD